MSKDDLIESLGSIIEIQTELLQLLSEEMKMERAEKETLRDELERVSKCYDTATGKDWGCGAGDVVYIECNQMTAFRTENKKLKSVLYKIAHHSPKDPLGDCAMRQWAVEVLKEIEDD